MPQQLALFPGPKTDYSAVVLDRSLARMGHERETKNQTVLNVFLFVISISWNFMVQFAIYQFQYETNSLKFLSPGSAGNALKFCWQAPSASTFLAITYL